MQTYRFAALCFQKETNRGPAGQVRPTRYGRTWSQPTERRMRRNRPEGTWRLAPHRPSGRQVLILQLREQRYIRLRSASILLACHWAGWKPTLHPR